MAAPARTHEDLTRWEPTTGPQVQDQRISYFDRLRATAVVGVVAYHALQPFGSIGTSQHRCSFSWRIVTSTTV